MKMKKALFLVIVLYKNNWKNSSLLPILERLLEQKSVGILIYDNSPQAQQHAFFERNEVTYLHNPQNPGLAKAYNEAVAQACGKYDRLLLLDQDTHLTLEYLTEAADFEFVDDVVAFVPRLFSEGRQLSPLSIEKMIGAHSQALPPGKVNSPGMAVNSGTCISLDYLLNTGGFNEEFPLDFLDHWFFFQLWQNKKTFWVSQCRLQHELSVLDYQQVSASRYRSILQGETHYYQNYQKAQWPFYRRHLLLRCLKQFLTVSNRQIWKLTWKNYWQS